MTITQDRPTSATVQDVAPLLLQQVAGFVGHRTIALGLRSGLVRAVADAGTAGTSADDLATSLGLDPFYVAVWCRAAQAAGVLERPDGAADGAALGGRFRLAEHMATLLLDATSPAYVGALFGVFEQDEMFGRFERTLASGERMWWEDCSPEWIAAVSGTGTPFYTRLVPAGLAKVPGLTERLERGVRVADTACGAGVGLVRLARAYPRSELVGVDGDAHSLDTASERLTEAGVGDRVALVHSPLEDFTLDAPVTAVLNNISMHECRDADEVTRRVLHALEPGGWFVISDFPFPDTTEALRTPPGRIMSGIQLFEAQIDDQLLPRATYDDLLTRHGFVDIGSTVLSPVHALTWGRKPA